MEKVTKEFKITADEDVMRRIERFLSFLHWNSRFGHSGVFGMALDGDGPEKVSVEPEPEHRHEVELISGVGYDLEMAIDNGCGGEFFDRDRNTPWLVQQEDSGTTLYKCDKPLRSLPRS